MAQLETADRHGDALPEAKVERLKDKIAKLKEEIARLNAINDEMMKSEDMQISLTDPDARSMARPARSPNLNAYAERWVRSVKEECLSKIILLCRIKPLFLSVLLDARSAEPRHAVPVDRGLPREKFIGCKHVTARGFLQGQQATANGCDNLCLATNDPAFCTRCRQIGDRQWAAIWPDHVPGPGSKGGCH
jgi:hypothetical protein